MTLESLNEILGVLDDIPNTESGRVFVKMLLGVVGSAFICAAPDIVDRVFSELEKNLRIFNAMVAEVVDE